MSELGKILLTSTLGVKDPSDTWLVRPETVESRSEALYPLLKQLRADLNCAVHDRQVFNMAVVIAGLQFLDRSLRLVYGEHFRGDIERLISAVQDNRDTLQTAVMSEAAKVLNDMALISRTEDSDSEFAIREGYEYVLTEDGIEIMLRETFIQYFSWCKRRGFTPLFANPDSFIVAMGRFPAAVDKLCPRSPLRRGEISRIFLFDLKKLAEEGVEGFKSAATD
jgi:hypothetical protein